MIVSKQNSLVKEVRSLLNKKFRDKTGRFIVEGVKMVNEAFLLNQKVLAVLCTEKCLGQINVNGFAVETVSEEVYGSISDEKSPQGVLAVLQKPDTAPIKPQSSCVLLDGVSDPGNMGTIIRTMACAGYKDLYLTSDCADPFSPKTVRSSMSGIYNVRVHIAKREQLLEIINLPIIVADMQGQNLFETRVKQDFCLVIGNEAHGVSDQVIEKSAMTVSIPMQEGMESLNAGVSAGILMYALKNQQ